MTPTIQHGGKSTPTTKQLPTGGGASTSPLVGSPSASLASANLSFDSSLTLLPQNASTFDAAPTQDLIDIETIKLSIDFENLLQQEPLVKIDIPSLTEVNFKQLNIDHLFGGLQFPDIFSGLNTAFESLMKKVVIGDLFRDLFKTATSIKPTPSNSTSSSSIETATASTVSDTDWKNGTSAATEAVMNGATIPSVGSNNPNIIRAQKFREHLLAANAGAQKFRSLSLFGPDGRTSADAGKQLLDFMLENQAAFAAVSSAEFADLLNQVNDVDIINNIKAGLNLYALVLQDEAVREQLIKNSGGRLNSAEIERLRNLGTSHEDISYELKSSTNALTSPSPEASATEYPEQSSNINLIQSLISDPPIGTITYPPAVSFHPELLAQLVQQQLVDSQPKEALPV